MEVKLQRVRDLASGRAQKLTREEAEALIRKLHIRGDWLATGEGPMLQSDGERRAQAALDRVGTAAQAASRLDLAESDGARLMELLYHVESGNGAAVRRVLAELAQLTPEEATLINSYRRCPEAARATLLQTAILLGAGMPAAQGAIQHVTADGGQVTQSGQIINAASPRPARKK